MKFITTDFILDKIGLFHVYLFFLPGKYFFSNFKTFDVSFNKILNFMKYI